MRISLCALLLVAFSAVSLAQQSLPDGPGKEITQKRCGACHSSLVVAAQDQTRDEWTNTINKMMGMGAQLTEDEFNQVLDYLSLNFPPKIRINRATAERIAAGLDVSQKEAEDIVRYREQKGSFKSFDDLLKVPGLDNHKLTERKKFIAFDN